MWRPIGCFSRKLSDTEQRYNTYDRELLAIFAVVKYCQRILEGRPFVVQTDHRPLIYAAHQRSDKGSPRVQGQLDYILQFDIRFESVKGEDNVVADALSRACTVTMPTILDSETIYQAQIAVNELPHLLGLPTLKLQRLDIEDKEMYCDVSTGIMRPYILSTLRHCAFNVIHGTAHPSGRSTTRLLAHKFFWPGLRKDAARWAKECEQCQRAKVHRHNRSALDRFSEPDDRFNHVHIDLIKLPQDMRADAVAKAFWCHWISQYGTPLTITSDQGKQFESALFTALSQLIGAKRIRTAPYNPQSNGLVERMHRTLKAALMCQPRTPWPELPPSVLLGLRNTYKEDLQASPAEMLYGTTFRVPGEFFVKDSMPADARSFASELRALFQVVKPVPVSRHSQHHPFVFKDLSPCTHVFRKVDKIREPLEPPYTGPHEVLKRLNDRSYVIRIDGQERTISTDSLNPAYLESADLTSPPPSRLPTLESPQPGPSTAAVKSAAMPLRAVKRVSFSSLPGEVTGVAVAARSPTS